MELTSVQKEILSTLISLYRRNPRSIRGEEIAEILGRNPGTIRNQMQSLKALQLVEGVPGPKGGYMATSSAYRELDLDTMAEEAHVILLKNGAEVNDIRVEEIDFTTVAHPDVCSAAIKVVGNIREFSVGDTIRLGPTPVNNLTIKGSVCGRNDAENKLIILVSEMISLPKAPVSEYVSDDLVTIDVDAPIKEVARILIDHNIQGAPVKRGEQLVGVITLWDLGKAVASGNCGSAGDVMTRNVLSVEDDRPVYEAIRLLQEHHVSRLVVTTNGLPKGVITRTDVLREILNSVA
ncbi:MAG TPA: CBS domain-containing protein [Candidatus Bathyarchaeia archaeon]|nr:CBS domain-containing protein [Candidatus Bathyarchaeia archaeon]